jgi:hypothetical protein
MFGRDVDNPGTVGGEHRGFRPLAQQVNGTPVGDR